MGRKCCIHSLEVLEGRPNQHINRTWKLASKSCFKRHFTLIWDPYSCLFIRENSLSLPHPAYNWADISSSLGKLGLVPSHSGILFIAGEAPQDSQAPNNHATISQSLTGRGLASASPPHSSVGKVASIQDMCRMSAVWLSRKSLSLSLPSPPTMQGGLALNMAGFMHRLGKKKQAESGFAKCWLNKTAAIAMLNISQCKGHRVLHPWPWLTSLCCSLPFCKHGDPNLPLPQAFW